MPTEVGVDQYMVGIAAGSLGILAYARSYYSRATRLFYRSLMTGSVSEVAGQKYYHRDRINIPRGNFPTAVIIKGEHRSGKSFFVANYILQQRCPWWMRILAPVNGFFLQGNKSSVTAEEWFKRQLNLTGKEDPIQSVATLVTMNYEQQYIRRFLLYLFGKSLSPVLSPQPSIMIIDQTEELLIHHRADFVNVIYPLVKMCNGSPDVLQLFLVVKSDNGQIACIPEWRSDLYCC
jgi:hypothetical protein